MGPRVRGDDTDVEARVASTHRYRDCRAVLAQCCKAMAYRSALHALTAAPISVTSGSRIVDGVREKRGAGAGWVTPWRSTNTPRAAMWACFGASAMVSTGAKQMSVPSMIAHHSSRVLLLNTVTSFSFSAGQAFGSI